MDVFFNKLLLDLNSDLYYTFEYLIWLTIILGALCISCKILIFILNQSKY